MRHADPHSFYDETQPRAKQLRLKLDVDFKTKRIEGEVVLVFGHPVSGLLDLDTNGLEIRGVQVPGTGEIAWTMDDPVAILGQRLRLDLPEAKKQPADLTEILRASVAAAKGGGRGKSDDGTDEDAEDTKSSAKPKSRRRASA